MFSNKTAEAQWWLLGRFGAPQKGRLHPGLWIERVITEFVLGKPPRGGLASGLKNFQANSPEEADLEAALDYVAADRWETDSRELRIIDVARKRGMSWREIATHLGLDSPQAAQQRRERLADRTKYPLIYAFRIAGEGQPWHGRPDALPDDTYQAANIDFNSTQATPFGGKTLEVRYGAADDDGDAPWYTRIFAVIGGQRVGVTARVQQKLFGG